VAAPLTVSQNYYDGPSPRRSLKYLYTQYSITISRQLSSHTDASGPCTHWHGYTCTRPTVIRSFVTGRAAIQLSGTKKQTVNPLSSRRTTLGRYVTKGQPLYMKTVDRTTDR